MKIKWERVAFAIVIAIAVIAFVILIVSGAIEVNMLKAWEWIVTELQAMPGKMIAFISNMHLRDFGFLVLGGVIGYLIKGIIIKHKNS